MFQGDDETKCFDVTDDIWKMAATEVDNTGTQAAADRLAAGTLVNGHNGGCLTVFS